jgi:hypothetical protein
LSVIENPKPSSGRDYGDWLGDNKKPTASELVREAVDAVLEQKPSSFEDFISLMEAAGFAMKHGKHIKFTAPGFTKGTRLDTLGGDYSEAAVYERIDGRRVRSAPAGKARSNFSSNRPSLLIDIEAKLREGKGDGYAHWAAVRNLKQMAKTLIYLQERGLDDYGVLKAKTAAATEKFNDLSDRLKELDGKLTANSTLQKHIVTYLKTRDTYSEYRKSHYSKKFRATHEADILLHQTAKKAFDELGYNRNNKLPTIASLRAEYTPTLELKKAAYAEFRTVRDEMRELLVAKSNVDRLLDIKETRNGRETERSEL